MAITSSIPARLSTYGRFVAIEHTVFSIPVILAGTLLAAGGWPSWRVLALTNGILQTRLDGQNEHDISSTPTFIIEGEPYAGSRSVDDFSALIDPLLDQS